MRDVISWSIWSLVKKNKNAQGNTVKSVDDDMIPYIIKYIQKFCKTKGKTNILFGTGVEFGYHKSGPNKPDKHIISQTLSLLSIYFIFLFFQKSGW